MLCTAAVNDIVAINSSPIILYITYPRGWCWFTGVRSLKTECILINKIPTAWVLYINDLLVWPLCWLSNNCFICPSNSADISCEWLWQTGGYNTYATPSAADMYRSVHTLQQEHCGVAMADWRHLYHYYIWNTRNTGMLDGCGQNIYACTYIVPRRLRTVNTVNGCSRLGTPTVRSTQEHCGDCGRLYV